MAEYNFYVSNKKIKTDSKECMSGVWGTSFACSLILFLTFLAFVATSVLLAIFVKWWLAIPVGLFGLLILSFLVYGYENLGLLLARQENFSKGIMFSGFKNFRNIFSLSIKKFFLRIIWLVMLVVPFFVNNIGYSMANFLMIESKENNSSNALANSKHLLKNNYGRYFKFLLSNTLWFLLILVTGGIAFLWVGQLLATRKALFYENLKTDF